MLGNRSWPMIGKISELLVSGNLGSVMDIKIQSPRGVKSYDLRGVVGLGIVAALENSGEVSSTGGSEILARHALFDRKTNRTDSISVNHVRKTEQDDFEKPTKSSIFCVSPERFADDVTVDIPVKNFLSSCHLCRRKLYGKDIYMYRGEQAFCSVDCREHQIMIDDRKEKCRLDVTRAIDVSNLSYVQENIFSTSILAI